MPHRHFHTLNNWQRFVSLGNETLRKYGFALMLVSLNSLFLFQLLERFCCDIPAATYLVPNGFCVAFGASLSLVIKIIFYHWAKNSTRERSIPATTNHQCDPSAGKLSTLTKLIHLRHQVPFAHFLAKTIHFNHMLSFPLSCSPWC